MLISRKGIEDDRQAVRILVVCHRFFNCNIKIYDEQRS